MEQNKTPIIAPTDWGGSKSNTHYAWIDNKVHAIRPTKEFVFYAGRWRHIQDDGLGGKYVEGPDFVVLFEIKEFDKSDTEQNKKERYIYDPTAGDGIEGVCGNCLNGGHSICDHEDCKCAAKGHKPWWWVLEGQNKILPLTLTTNPLEVQGVDEVATIWRDDKEGSALIAALSGSPGREEGQEFGKRLVSAYNNTYVAGINPEAVGDLLDALRKANDYLRATAHGASYQQFGLEAIEKAKL